MLIFHVVLAIAAVLLASVGLLFAGAITLVINLAWAFRTFVNYKVGLYK